MAKKSNVTAMAVAIQGAVGVFTTPTQPGDLMPISNLRPQIQGVTIDNDEYTGGIARNAPTVAGKNMTFSFNVKLRPPGGADLPAANAYLPGRLLQAAKFTEVRTATAIPASPEAVAGSGNTTTKAVLGTTASATAGIYTGFPLVLSDNGSGFKNQLTAIADYDDAKGATLPETLGAAPAANYQIPKFLGYYRSITADDPPRLSVQIWFGGNRYDLKDCSVTGMRCVVPTSTKTQAAFPEFEFTLSATIDDYAAQAAPSVPVGGAVPLYKDGNQWLSNVAVGGSSFTIDMGVESEDPPNPNEADGTDPAELISTTARLSMQRQFYAKDVFDSLEKADTQAYHPFWAQWGQAGGSIVGIIVPKARFDYASPDLSGGLVGETGDLMIDANDRGVGFYFPYAA